MKTQLEKLALFLSSAIVLGAIVIILLFCFQRRHEREKEHKTIIPLTSEQKEFKEQQVEMTESYTSDGHELIQYESDAIMHSTTCVECLKRNERK